LTPSRDEQIYAQFNTNVFGAFRVTKGAIPTFRAQRNGTIVNISSTAGMTGSAAYSMYAGTKFALEGASEGLAAELAPFGIRVLIVEPGGFRTNFQAVVSEPQDWPQDYTGTPADQIRQHMRSSHGKQPGDPDKAAQAIVEAVTGTGRGKDVEGCLRLPLGKDALARAEMKVSRFTGDVEKVKHISASVLYPEGQ
jgi:NAD(P)-dependent dehydrogenase (short-subunit alcohol dehydrogenase family)